MNSVTKISGKPLSGWIKEIKAQARAKLHSARFIAACRQGDRTVMRGLVIGLWPFIDEFPKIIIRSVARLPQSCSTEHRQLLNTMLRRGQTVMSGIRRDEQNHRKLWLETGKTLGLAYPTDFARPVLGQTQAWIDAVNEPGDPFTVFIRFAAIEIIAEAVSVELLASDAFVAALGRKGSEWFRVHAEHGMGISHEELEFRLAFSFLETPPCEAITNSIVQRIVDLSLAAEEASARSAQQAENGPR